MPTTTPPEGDALPPRANGTAAADSVLLRSRADLVALFASAVAEMRADRLDDEAILSGLVDDVVEVATGYDLAPQHQAILACWLGSLALVAMETPLNGRVRPC